MNTILAFSVMLLVGAVCSTPSAHADIPPAYHTIANDYQIPVEVFYAVMLQESGKTTERKFLPKRKRPSP
jgi:hypothetical protein